MKKTKTSWDLTLLYKSEKDPQIEKDLVKIEKACAAFEKKYRNVDYTSTPEKLAKALADSEALYKAFNGNKPWWYFALRTSLNSDDKIAGSMATKNEQRITNADNKLTFFNLRIGKIPKVDQKRFLKHKELVPYAYKLKRIFDNAIYQLSEGEEQIIDLLSQTSYTMWTDGQEKVLNQQTVTFKGKALPIPEVAGKLAELSDKDRNELWKLLRAKLKEISSFAEAEINAIYNYKKILDERRGFAKPYSSSMLSYENDEKEIEALVDLVTKHFHIANRFYRVHAKLLGKKKLTYADRLAKAGKINRKYSYEDTLKIVGKALGKIDPKYAAQLERYSANGQIDVYPKKGKSGGAFCWGMGELPTFVLLNHVDSIRSVETLGHEMGHAIHNELSQSQPPRYRKYSLSVAETASTFFEQASIEELEKGLSDREKIIFLHNRIQGDINTVFRQIACFNFEKELHEEIRKKGQVSKGDIADLMSKHMRSYIGGAADITHDDGYTFVSWSHIRNFFYVYTYTYGQLVSRALYEKWKADSSFAKKVEQFLRAGRSTTPGNIFKSIGIDTSDPEFFKAGLKGIESDIKKLEKLTAKMGK